MLTQQEGIDDPCTIVMHPWQLVAACQHLGLTAGDPQAAKTIATLQRRTVALRDRIETLSDWMAQYSDHKHADLSYETTQLNAMADLASEWCRDFEESEQDAQPSSLSTVDSDKLEKKGAPSVHLSKAEKKGEATSPLFDLVA